MKHDRTTSPEETGPSGSTPPPSAEGVEFVKPEDLDYEMDCLIAGATRAVERMRANGLLPEQQEPKSKDEQSARTDNRTGPSGCTWRFRRILGASGPADTEGEFFGADARAGG